MKKAALIMVVITLLFCAFSAGFFLGRSTGSNSISVSAVPTKQTTDEPSSPTDSTDESLPFPLDINTATAQELTLLPGIGEKLAANIIAYRDENGPFENLADLVKVEGVGEKKLENILDYITIGGQP